MTYKYGKFAEGTLYRYTRGKCREYACKQCGAWHSCAVTVCGNCVRVNSMKLQQELLGKKNYETEL